MRTFFTVIAFICLLTTTAVGQHITKKYSLPGFVQLNGSLLISVTETDIRGYAGFLIVMRKLSTDSGFMNKIFP